jgi:hypothetical protein
MGGSVEHDTSKKEYYMVERDNIIFTIHKWRSGIV